jgi:hypothetical protein
MARTMVTNYGMTVSIWLTLDTAASAWNILVKSDVRDPYIARSGDESEITLPSPVGYDIDEMPDGVWVITVFDMTFDAPRLLESRDTGRTWEWLPS